MSNSKTSEREVLEGNPAELAKKIIDTAFKENGCLILSVGTHEEEGECQLFMHASAAYKMGLVEQLIRDVIKDNGDMPRPIVAMFVAKTVGDAVKRVLDEDKPKEPETVQIQV